MIFDLSGISSRIGSMAFDVKQVAEENKRKAWIFIGALTVLILGIFIVLKWRR